MPSVVKHGDRATSTVQKQPLTLPPRQSKLNVTKVEIYRIKDSYFHMSPTRGDASQCAFVAFSPQLQLARRNGQRKERQQLEE